MAQQWVRLYVAATLLICSVCATAQNNHQDNHQNDQKPDWLPEELLPWRAWVLFDHPDANCPFLTGLKERSCVWPGAMTLHVDGNGGRFTMALTALADTWFTLPGGRGHWPLAVTVASATGADTLGTPMALPVVSRNHLPRVHLPVGKHSISGHFQWPELPQQLPMPAEVVLLRVTGVGAGGAPLNLAGERDAQGNLWLRKPATESDRKPEQDVLNLQVFRRLTDGQPQTLATEVQLQVAGRPREVRLGPLLPEGFTPRDINSPLPARLEADGVLRMQVRAGRYHFQFDAHSVEPHQRLTMAGGESSWPGQEIWAFQAVPELRTVLVTGAPVIDGSQTTMPDSWQALPAYLLEPGVTLNLAEQYRGDPTPAENVLVLHKQLWLDFDGDRLTAQDRITGQMSRDWRLETVPAYELGRVSLAGSGQLISVLPGADSAGVEVRSQKLDLEAVSRVPRRATLPVSGWRQPFTEISTTLNLPPGWTALHLTGADRVSGTWVSRWNLWNIFLLLVVSVAVWRAIGWKIGALTLVTLTLIFHRAGAPVLPWLNLAGCFALLPYANDRYQRWLHLYLGVSLLGTALVCLPFLVQQARSAIYPQLEQRGLSAMPYRPVAEQSAMAELTAASDALPAASGINRTQGKRAGEPYRVQYDPDQKIQVGPGLPDWRWRSVTARWSGPVLAGEAFDLPRGGGGCPGGARLLCWRRGAAGRGVMGLRDARQRPLRSLPFGKSMATTLLALVAAANNERAEAKVEVDAGLLQTLAERLTAPPSCLPDCAAIEQLQLQVDAQTLTLSLTVTNQTAVGVPLPGSLEGWLPTTLTVDGEPGAALRAPSGRLFVHLPAGRHAVTLTGSVRALKNIELDFALPLHQVSVSAEDWEINGLPSSQQASQLLSLTRMPTSAELAGDRLAPAPVTPFVQIRREIALGLEWTVTTTVTRVAPVTGAIHLALPLLAGEAPVSGERHADGTMDLRLDPAQNDLRFNSVLPVTDRLHLLAPTDVAWTEVWQVVSGPMWHTEFEGPAPVIGRGEDVWPSWQPRPGETLTLNVSRPQPAAGSDLAIDQVTMNHRPGRKASETEMSLTVRASLGQRLPLALPPGAELKRVTVNGTERPVPLNGNRLDLPVTPGEQTFTIIWQTRAAVGTFSQMPVFDLGTQASNINLTLELPGNRWLLATGGPALGPAILFWGVLAVVLMLAIGLSRTGLTPLRTWEWLLLSLGVATIHLGVLALTAVWFIAMTLRGRLHQQPQKPAFNALQVMLMLLSAVTLITLAGSVPSSLLSNPDMYVTGNSSSAHWLRWYYDRADGRLPQAWALSLPMGIYRLLMLLWSLWLAFALMRWLKWGWQQLHAGAFWVVPPPRSASSPTPPVTGTEEDPANRF